LAVKYLLFTSVIFLLNVFYFVHRRQFNGHYYVVVNHYRNSLSWWRGRHGGDRIVVGFITTYAISAYHH